MQNLQLLVERHIRKGIIITVEFYTTFIHTLRGTL